MNRNNYTSNIWQEIRMKITMGAETIKTCLEISGIFLAAIAVILVWLMSVVHKVRITALFRFPDTIKLEILCTSYDPARKLARMVRLLGNSPTGKRYVYSKVLSPDEAGMICSKRTTLFLPRGLPEQTDLRYIGIEVAPKRET